jgi:hypothetical protein
MTTIELSDEDAAAFILFRKHQNQIESLGTAWQEVIDYATNKVKNGNITITLQNKKPVRVSRPMQGFVIGLQTEELI